jgi:molecular chaperone GrpE (heat shock protein)
MDQNYNKYLEEIKKKLDQMNKASGFDPEFNKQIQREQAISNQPSNEIFDMLGAGYNLWKRRKEEENNTKGEQSF